MVGTRAPERACQQFCTVHDDAMSTVPLVFERPCFCLGQVDSRLARKAVDKLSP